MMKSSVCAVCGANAGGADVCWNCEACASGERQCRGCPRCLPACGGCGRCDACLYDGSGDGEGFTGPAEFDAVFGWELAPLDETPEPRESLGNCTGCDRTYVYVDSRWSMCTRCWDAIPAEYDAWVASLPKAIPMDEDALDLADAPVAPACWPLWVLFGLGCSLVLELAWLLS